MSRTTLDPPAPPVPADAPALTGEARLRAIAGTALLLIAVGAGILFGDPLTVGALLAVVSLVYLFRSAIFSWQGAVIALVVIVCLVPARRYTLPVSLPFAAEPYRLFVLLLLVVVVVALLIDPRFRWGRLELSGPVGVFLGTQLLSIGVNVPGLVQARLAPDAIVALLSFIIICLLFVVARQLLQTERLVMLTIKTAVVSGAIVGVLSMFERVTRSNYFLDFFALLPLQRLSDEESLFVKEGTARAFGPSQHPIALAVFLVMLIPLGIYLARHADWPRRPAPRELFWLFCTMLIALGMLAAVSRTAFVSIAVMVVAVILLRPAILPRLLIYGSLAALAALTISAQNIIAMVSELMNPAALIESQMSSPGWTGSGRLADLGPSLEEAGISPFFGSGLGSRVTTGPTANAFILDNQYLTTLLESGLIGVIGALVLLLVPFGRLAVMSQRSKETEPRRDLALALALSILGYSVALIFFDGFSFIQTILAFFLLLAIASWLLAADKPSWGIERRMSRQMRAML